MGIPVILDAAFLKQSEREAARELAVKADADFFIVECTVPEMITRSRCEARLGEPSISDGRWEIYLKQKAWLEPVPPGMPHILVDTSLPLAQNVNQVLERINR